MTEEDTLSKDMPDQKEKRKTRKKTDKQSGEYCCIPLLPNPVLRE